MVKGLISALGQAIDVHGQDPLLVLFTGYIPARDDALIAVALVAEQLADMEPDVLGAGGAAQDGFARGVELVHSLGELYKTVALGEVGEQGQGVA